MTAAQRRYAFLGTPRWVGLVAVMVAVAVACVFLGRWQWQRYEDRSANARQVAAVYDAAPLPLARALPALTRPARSGDPTGGGPPLAGPVTPADQWRAVELEGEYLPDSVLLLRNRPVDGTPAVHVVALFRAALPDGDLLVVTDRGWLPAEAAEDPAAVPAPPSGPVTLVARLRVAEPPVDRAPPPGQVYTLTPAEVVAAAGSADPGLPVLNGHVTAVAEAPGASGAGPGADAGEGAQAPRAEAGEGAQAPAADAAEGAEATAAAPPQGLGGYGRPSFNYGLNLSYAIQWWIFAVAALGALVVLARREAADRAGEAPVRRVRAAEAEEDALIDAQLAAAAGAAEPPAARSPQR